MLRDMVSITLRTEISKNERTNLETCITVHMHQKESAEDLLKKKVKDPSDFEWLKQVRECVCRTCVSCRTRMCLDARVCVCLHACVCARMRECVYVHKSVCP